MYYLQYGLHVKKKNHDESHRTSFYKQFSKDVYFALKGLGFFPQLVMQVSGTEQLILPSRGHWRMTPRGLTVFKKYETFNMF